jgi:hypothetical protein
MGIPRPVRENLAFFAPSFSAGATNRNLIKFCASAINPESKGSAT